MNRLYTISLTVALPLLFLRLKRKAKTLPAYKERWGERLGHYQQAPYANKQPLDKPSIWIHTVSVGEFIAAKPLIAALIKQYADVPIVVTTTTPTGSEQVVKTFGDQVQHVYLPFDLPWLIKRFVKQFKPSIALIMETELWPNLLDQLNKLHIPSVLLNARLSERSAQKYQKIPKTVAYMMQNTTQIISQNNDDGQRFVKLGLNPKKLNVAGNIKFDMSLPEDIEQKASVLKQHINTANRPLWVVASTHEGEEQKILDIFKEVKQQKPNVLLCLIPRHPDRFNHVFQLTEDHGFKVERRSQADTLSDDIDIVLGDSMGEMLHYYACADIAFVGGSLIPIGGHNLIEPALLSLPILSGPHLQNFVELKNLLLKDDALIICDEKQLKDKVIFYLDHLEAAKALGEKAFQVAQDNRGALQKHLDIIAEIYTAS